MQFKKIFTGDEKPYYRDYKLHIPLLITLTVLGVSLAGPYWKQMLIFIIVVGWLPLIAGMLSEKIMLHFRFNQRVKIIKNSVDEKTHDKMKQLEQNSTEAKTTKVN